MGALTAILAAVKDITDPYARARRVFAAADEEAARLTQAALESGALPSEVRIVWRFCRGTGVWPSM